MSRGLHIPRWVCAGIVGLGAAALVIQAAIDVYQGTRSMAWLSAEWWAQAWQMTLLTGFVLAFAAVGGCLLNMRAWGRAGLLYILVGGYMAITISNSMDFVADNTLANREAQRAKATQAKDITEIRNATALSERKEMLEGVWRTYYSAKTPADKAQALAQIKDITKDGPALVADDIKPVLAGSGGILHRWLGWREDAIQEAKAIALPILIMIGKATAITLGFAFWPQLPPLRVGQTKANLSFKVGKVCKEDAQRDIVHLIVTSKLDELELTAADMARRWGVTEPTAGAWVRQFTKDKLVTRTRIGEGNRLVIRPAAAAASKFTGAAKSAHLNGAVNSGDNHAPAINGRAHAV